MERLFVRLDKCKDGEAVPLDDHECFYSRGMLKLLQMVCIDLGPAAQTLGALLVHATSARDYSTYAAVETLAETASLNRRTVLRHLKALESSGWIKNLGRQRLPGSKMKRRTCTIKLLPKAVIEQKWFPLPRWLAASDLTWGEKLMLAYLASQRCIAYVNEELEQLGSLDGREEMKRTEICNHTGLSRNTYWNSRSNLLDLALVDYGNDGDVTRMRLNPEVGVRIEGVQAGGPERFDRGSCLPKSVTAHSPNLSQELPKSVTQGAQKCHSLLTEPSNRILLTEPPEKTSQENRLSEHERLADSPAHDADFYFRIDGAEDREAVSRICKAIGIRSGQCKAIWALACLRRHSAITEDVLEGAIDDCKNADAKDPIAYIVSRVHQQIGKEKLTEFQTRTLFKRGVEFTVPRSPKTVAEIAGISPLPLKLPGVD